MSTPFAPIWFTSSYSGGSGTECVECAHSSRGILVRDSKRKETGEVITVGNGAWLPFLAALRDGRRVDTGHFS
jgi:hypothetical protein